MVVRNIIVKIAAKPMQALHSMEFRKVALMTKSAVERNRQEQFGQARVLPVAGLESSSSNPGIGLDMRWIERVRDNRPAAVRRVSSLRGLETLNLKVGAVCVYHAMAPTAAEALAGSRIPMATFSTGSLAGLLPVAQPAAEVEASVADGARERLQDATQVKTSWPPYGSWAGPRPHAEP